MTDKSNQGTDTTDYSTHIWPLPFTPAGEGPSLDAVSSESNSEVPAGAFTAIIERYDEMLRARVQKAMARRAKTQEGTSDKRLEELAGSSMAGSVVHYPYVLFVGSSDKSVEHFSDVWERYQARVRNSNTFRTHITSTTNSALGARFYSERKNDTLDIIITDSRDFINYVAMQQEQPDTAPLSIVAIGEANEEPKPQHPVSQNKNRNAAELASVYDENELHSAIVLAQRLRDEQAQRKIQHLRQASEQLRIDLARYAMEKGANAVQQYVKEVAELYTRMRKEFGEYDEYREHQSYDLIYSHSQRPEIVSLGRVLIGLLYIDNKLHMTYDKKHDKKQR